MTELEIVHPGPLATVQDLGRAGHASLGVSPSGACDRGSIRLGNRLVGNDEGAAAIETTAGGLVIRAHGRAVVALSGAPTAPTVTGRPVGMATPLTLEDGAELRLGPPARGLRTYVAVRGGLDLPRTLGSRSADTLAGLGPRPLQPGDRLPVAVGLRPWSPVDVAPIEIRTEDPMVLEVRLGPRDDWFDPTALESLTAAPYVVSHASNRIGIRLIGAALRHRGTAELPSEGLVRGAIQVPPSGQPTLLLADHPVTGGYPVIAVVTSADLDAAGQAAPGHRVRFRVTMR